MSTMTHTFESILTVYNVTIPDSLIADAEVPVLCGPQRQGDVGIFPRGPLGAAERNTAQPVPTNGVAVVRGEAATGGNTHWLHAEGPCTWTPAAARAGEVRLGVLDVPEGAVAYLIHTDEHGANGIGPGTYRLTGKREQADDIRRVAD
jgi:hypothetical protein